MQATLRHPERIKSTEEETPSKYSQACHEISDTENKNGPRRDTIAKFAKRKNTLIGSTFV